MLKIEPIEEVVTKRSVMLTLDEDEIAKVLVDPRDLQKQLRQVKRQWNGRASWSSSGHADAGKARIGKKAEKKSSEKKQRGQKCPKCHRVFKKLGRHSSTCTGNKDPFGATTASPLDE